MQNVALAATRCKRCCGNRSGRRQTWHGVCWRVVALTTVLLLHVCMHIAVHIAVHVLLLHACMHTTHRLQEEVAALKGMLQHERGWKVGTTTEDVRLTPLLARGGEAVAQLGKLSARVAALRDRLQDDE